MEYYVRLVRTIWEKKWRGIFVIFFEIATMIYLELRNTILINKFGQFKNSLDYPNLAVSLQSTLQFHL